MELKNGFHPTQINQFCNVIQKQMNLVILLKKKNQQSNKPSALIKRVKTIKYSVITNVFHVLLTTPILFLFFSK